MTTSISKQLNSANKIALCRLHLTTDPSSISPCGCNISATQLGTNSSLQRVSKHMPFGSTFCHVNWYQKIPHYLLMPKCNFPDFFLYMCIHIVLCISLVCRQIGVYIVDIPNDSSLIFLASNFSIVICMKYSRLIH
jgi:hypothetical protein